MTLNAAVKCRFPEGRQLLLTGIVYGIETLQGKYNISVPCWEPQSCIAQQAKVCNVY